MLPQQQIINLIMLLTEIPNIIKCKKIYIVKNIKLNFKYISSNSKYIKKSSIFAVKNNNKEIYWERRPEYPFNICKDVEFSLRCENSKGDHISVHRFTNMVAYDTKDMENFLIYKCNLVEQKF